MHSHSYTGTFHESQLNKKGSSRLIDKTADQNWSFFFHIWAFQSKLGTCRTLNYVQLNLGSNVYYQIQYQTPYYISDTTWYYISISIACLSQNYLSSHHGCVSVCVAPKAIISPKFFFLFIPDDDFLLLISIYVLNLEVTVFSVVPNTYFTFPCYTTLLGRLVNLHPKCLV